MAKRYGRPRLAQSSRDRLLRPFHRSRPRRSRPETAGARRQPAAGYGLAQPDGFEAQLAAIFPGVTIVDGAVSGDTTAGGLARLDWALADGADAAIVELGGMTACAASIRRTPMPTSPPSSMR